MTECGFVSLDGSPGFFYHPVLNADVVVYVDDFILIAPPEAQDKIWRMLDEAILFKDPPVDVDRFFRNLSQNNH